MKAAPWIAGLAGLLLAGAASAGTPDGATIARQGNGRGVAPCAACHNADGGGQPAAGFPRLAGLPSAYLLKQLDDFAHGTRRNATMQPVAAGLSQDERAALAAYYSKLPVPAMSTTPVTDPRQEALGERLATRGRWSHGLPGCGQCHGPGGVGVGGHFPPLAGQSAVYIANQLHAWQKGMRRNDPLQLMQAVAGKLDEADIAAVSAWYAAQPVAGGQQP
ncbi:c-type cytochrome [Fulvimonas sp. R45]|uniref:c-type cytochrome n=1 Tax=Fulvimonas sp. R45 TaxID=3045937 RepID=UPI00265D8288|nr:c-type cytochrome [Fulvimonas sp. R45]MDO1528910.1 c-type cytochrome [Fulvimonas sp. R45]